MHRVPCDFTLTSRTEPVSKLVAISILHFILLKKNLYSKDKSEYRDIVVLLELDSQRRKQSGTYCLHLKVYKR